MACMQLFCLPYAGGAATQLFAWQKILGDQVRVIPVELPGRGRRMGEALHTQFDDLLSEVASCVCSQLDGTPYAILGHSMGGMLAFELAKKLQREEKPVPEYLILSGTKLPSVSTEQYSTLSDDQFTQRIKALGGMSEEVLENEELMAFFLPIIRADFQVVETYSPKVLEEPLRCKVVLFQGDEDAYTKEDALSEWHKLVAEPLKIYTFSGGHFFINEKRSEVLETLQGILT
ncbi:MAG: thioesterase II family protein [Cellulosilyticaceae bacterium]